MSANKFAPITSLLLARKGDAAPSLPGLPPRVSIKMVEGPADAAAMSIEHKFVYSPPPLKTKSAPAQSGSEAPPEKPRRIVLNLTPQEYETLGLVAVKKGVTRHQLAQSAIDAYFDWLVEEYSETCSCVVGGATERCVCRSN